MSDLMEFQFGTLRCQVNDDGWLTIKQDAEQGNKEQEIGVGKVDGARFKALDNAVSFMKNKQKEYIIYVCPKCKEQLKKEDMGKQYPNCNEWQYHSKAEKKVVLEEESP